MIGFTPNDVPFKASDDATEKETEVDFEKLWERRLELSSVEVRDARESYSREYRR